MNVHNTLLVSQQAAIQQAMLFLVRLLMDLISLHVSLSRRPIKHKKTRNNIRMSKRQQKLLRTFETMEVNWIKSDDNFFHLVCICVSLTTKNILQFFKVESEVI